MAKILLKRHFLGDTPVSKPIDHLYYEFIDDNGNRIEQVNGLSFDRNTQQYIDVGLPGDNDSIRIKFDGGNGFLGSSDPNEGFEYVIYEGSETLVRQALSYAHEFGRYINAQD